MKQQPNSCRVNEQAREVIANILLFDMADSNLKSVTVTSCEVSPDRSACNVYYTAPREQYEEVEAALNQARGRIRSLMAQQLSWRTAPELRFRLDSSVDTAQRIDSLLKSDRQRYMSDDQPLDENEDVTSPQDDVAGEL